MKQYSAKLVINLGDLAKDYFSIMEKPRKYKRSELRIKASAKKLEIEVNAKDATALIATLGSLIKQLSVIRQVDSLVEK